MIEVRKTVEEARHDMKRADLLLWKGPPGSFGRLIRIASRSEYSHAGMLDFRPDNGHGNIPVLIDVTTRGGRDIDLELEVSRHSGCWDLYRTNPYGRWKDFSREAACRRMQKFRGIDYGWPSIFKASLAFLPGIRVFQRYEACRVKDEDTENTPPFCSMAVSIACYAGGVDPVNRLYHSQTTPGNLSESKFFEYKCTLIDPRDRS